jgi:hypothetical protein
VAPWPKLFHNLRASRETELAAIYPIHVVCAWNGNTERIAAKHYMQVTEDCFVRASGKSGAQKAQNPAQQAAALSGTASQETQEPWENPGFLQEHAVACETVRAVGYPQGDSNESQESNDKPQPAEQRGTDSGTPLDATRLEALAAELGKLSPEDRARLAAMLIGDQTTRSDCIAPTRIGNGGNADNP